jgi:EAL domain-containing protein (putative c-di-GMP-specific phosphodiesterase class I)
LQVLEEMHCDKGQGFLFAKPVSANEICRLVQDQTIRSNH